MAKLMMMMMKKNEDVQEESSSLEAVLRDYRYNLQVTLMSSQRALKASLFSQGGQIFKEENSLTGEADQCCLRPQLDIWIPGGAPHGTPCDGA